MKKICIIGSLHWDIVVNTNKIPKKDETASGSKVHYLFGGKEVIKLCHQIDMGLIPILLEELERTILGKKYLKR